MLLHLFSQISPTVSPEWIAVVAGFVGLWVRLEHRLTRVETKLENLKRRNQKIDGEGEGE